MKSESLSYVVGCGQGRKTESVNASQLEIPLGKTGIVHLKKPLKSQKNALCALSREHAFVNQRSITPPLSLPQSLKSKNCVCVFLYECV